MSVLDQIATLVIWILSYIAFGLYIRAFFWDVPELLYDFKYSRYLIAVWKFHELQGKELQEKEGEEELRGKESQEKEGEEELRGRELQGQEAEEELRGKESQEKEGEEELRGRESQGQEAEEEKEDIWEELIQWRQICLKGLISYSLFMFTIGFLHLLILLWFHFWM